MHRESRIHYKYTVVEFSRREKETPLVLASLKTIFSVHLIASNYYVAF